MAGCSTVTPEAPPGDEQIREALRVLLGNAHRSDAQTVILEELGLLRGEVRVDLAVVNGVLHGYEIKSSRDTLRRLRSQVAIYGRVLDRATLVVGARHLRQAVSMLPEWWGVLVASPGSAGIELVTVRDEHDNPGRQARSLVELLWLEEATALLAERGDLRGARGKPRRVVWQRVCERYTLDEIAAVVRERLKARVARPESRASS